MEERIQFQVHEPYTTRRYVEAAVNRAFEWEKERGVHISAFVLHFEDGPTAVISVPRNRAGT